MGRGTVVAAFLLLALTLGAVTPAAAVTCPLGSNCITYAQSQADNKIAQLNVTSNILRLLTLNLTDNGRSFAYMSINSSMTSRHGMGVWEQVTNALSSTAICPQCAQNFSTGLGYYANNSSTIYGNYQGTTGRAALAREQTGYLQNNTAKAGNYASALTQVFRDAVLVYTETQKQIYSALGI